MGDESPEETSVRPTRKRSVTIIEVSPQGKNLGEGGSKLPSSHPSNASLDSSDFHHVGSSGAEASGAAVQMKPRAFFVGRQHVPSPPSHAVPLGGIRIAEAPGYIDTARTPFSTLLLATVGALVLVSLALFVLPMFDLFMHDVAAPFRYGIPGGLLLVAIVAAFNTTHRAAHFDRSARVLKFSKKRLIGGCCGGVDEIPFRVFKGVKPNTTLGSTVQLLLVIDTRKLCELRRDDATDNSSPEEKTEGTEEDVDDEELTVAEVENAPDVLRSWERYVAWLRDDAF
uniref:Uncharacterized protein n=1 Tax=Neobodo designis TaxID=312471 RepID=A0A7S1LVD8_NEODS|mmetsp:Transcript_289/g.1119  ORF Transcript_289/g.1119 Transcript_289/m.1119 type:complete len:284 (+) Transcript_289:58-909(+)